MVGWHGTYSSDPEAKSKQEKEQMFKRWLH